MNVTLYHGIYFIEVAAGKTQRIAELKAEGWAERAEGADEAAAEEVEAVKPAAEVKPAAAPKKGAKGET